MYKTKVKLFDEFLILNPTIIKYFLDLQTITVALVPVGRQGGIKNHN
jgi:hypothetical protein